MTKEESLQRKKVAEFFSQSERLFEETLGGASTKQSEIIEREVSTKFSLKNLFHRTSTKKHESQEPASLRFFFSLKKFFSVFRTFSIKLAIFFSSLKNWINSF